MVYNDTEELIEPELPEDEIHIIEEDFNDLDDEDIRRELDDSERLYINE